MATTVKSDDSLPEEDVDEAAPDTSAAKAALRARLSRKRTKTGCLTCRKRRIKCDEERPVCKNCIKSKRHCEGYNQRVVFKTPTIDYRHLQNGAASITFQPGAMGSGLDLLWQNQDNAGHTYSQLRPRPTGLTEQYYPDVQPQPYAYYPGYPGQHGIPLPMYQVQPIHYPAMALQSPYVGPAEVQPSFLPGGDAMPIPNNEHGHAVRPVNFQQSGPQSGQPGAQNTPAFVPLNAGLPTSSVQPIPYHLTMPSLVPAWPGTTGPAMHVPTSTVGYHPATQHVAPTLELHQPQAGAEQRRPTMPESTALNQQQRWDPRLYTPRPELVQPIDFRSSEPRARHDSSSEMASQQQNQSATEYAVPHTMVISSPPLQFSLADSTNPGRLLDEAAIEVQDDEFYDVDSEDEMEWDTTLASDSWRRQTMESVMYMSRLNIGEQSLRHYHAFVDNGMLDTYRPEWAANPLKNPTTARVFAHFVSAVGPTISTFTRRSRQRKDSAIDGTVPFSQQGLWTYAMPLAALNHQGLLQAMLAMSSLHIARLTGASETPSIKHYAYALKRIHHCVGHPVKRHSVPVMAASLLLGIYELWSADHVKWNSHLAGAKQLVVETEYAQMNKEVRRMKAARMSRYQQPNTFPYQPGNMHSPPYPGHGQDALLDQIPDIDSQVVSIFAGKAVDYDDFGHVVDDSPKGPKPRWRTVPLDIARFEIQKDLFWWYCKQDMIQTVVSGNPLLLPFSRWTDCPPRAPMNRADAVYGTYDHLLILLGRIADFGVRDRKRKLQVMAQNGGHWRPAPGMQLGPPGHAQQPVGPGSQAGDRRASAPAGSRQGQAPPPMPAFYGMAPSAGGGTMPSSYQTDQSGSQPGTPQMPDFSDLTTATTKAIEEWGEIRAALHTFEQILGASFMPLPEDCQQAMQTPFGPALFYRSYDISCLWALFNTAIIITTRSHPHMPPHAHMAAGVAAQQTRQFADEIGRIVAGMVPPPQYEPLNPTLGAAFCDSCVPLFFAGVQYQSPAQREWTVTRLFEIERRCGYVTAGIIANGCQTAWSKAFKAGRGPPYERRYNTQAEDGRVNGLWESMDMRVQPSDDDITDRRFVHTKPAARLHWAVGILGTEEDR